MFYLGTISILSLATSYSMQYSRAKNLKPGNILPITVFYEAVMLNKIINWNKIHNSFRCFQKWNKQNGESIDINSALQVKSRLEGHKAQATDIALIGIQIDNDPSFSVDQLCDCKDYLSNNNSSNFRNKLHT